MDCLSSVILSPLNGNVRMSPHERQETFTLSQKELQRVAVISRCVKGEMACQRRLREAREGELVQLDALPHDWLEGRGPRFIFDLPRPNRDDDISPERAFENCMAELHTRFSTPVEPDGYDGWTSIPDKSN